MKRIILLLLAALAIIFAAVGIGYGYLSGSFNAAKEKEEGNVRKVLVRGDGTQAELSEQNLWLYRQYIVSVPTPEVMVVPAQEVAKQDFSPNADTVTDANGYQTIPDNSTVMELTGRKLRTKYFTVWIPGCWVGNVVVECRYIDQAVDESSEDPDAVRDTISLRFYEKQNYETYVSGADNEYPYATGLITELRYTNASNDNSWLKTSNYETYVGDGRLGEFAYNIFLYEIHNSNDLTRPEYETEYMYLTKVNYPGCIINSLKVTGGGKVKYTDETQEWYVDTWDDQAEGISLGSVIPEDGLLASEREDGPGQYSTAGPVPEATGEGGTS